MTIAPDRPVVAVFNSNADLVDLLRTALNQAGFVVVTGHIQDIRDGRLDLINFVAQHDPRVIVYDLVPPYEANWDFLNHLRAREPLKGRQFVLTSTNAKVAQELAMATEAVYEVIGKPFDLDQIVQATREASRARPVGE